MRERKYPPEEIARRAAEWYQNSIRAQVETGNFGKRLIIDVDTGEFEIGNDSLEMSRRMIERDPDRQLFGMRIGYPAMSKRGGSWGPLNGEAARP